MSEWKDVLLTEITTKIGDGLHGTLFMIVMVNIILKMVIIL